MSFPARPHKWFGRAALVGAMTFGCFSLEDLSSYSVNGSPAAGAGPGSSDNGGAAGSDGADALVDGGTPSASDAAGSNASEAPLDPAAVGLDPPAPVSVVSAAEQCVDAGGFPGLDSDTCYRLIDEPSPWLAARSECQGWGGDLVEITTPEENNFLASEVEGSVWLGQRRGRRLYELGSRAAR
jgi:hypothetical protein